MQESAQAVVNALPNSLKDTISNNKSPTTSRGVLWVSSRISPDAKPASSTPKLVPEKFCDWYENTHIQQVLALLGVVGATRYEKHSTQPSPTSWSAEAPWLTVYEMPDIDYRNTSEFKALDGQSKPEESLLKGVFEQARFDTRFYRETQVYPPGQEESGNGRGNLFISAALQPASGAEEDFEKWYREEHCRMLAQCKGYVRTRRYELVHASTLDRFVRSEPEVGTQVARFLALHEFEAEDWDWDGLGRSAVTEWAKKVMGNLGIEEIGWYARKRIYS